MATARKTIPMDDGSRLVVELHDDGNVRLSDMLAVGKRRRKGEIPRTMSLRTLEIWERGMAVDEVGAIFDDLIKRMPTADFSGTPDKVGYQAKAWLMKELKKRGETACSE